jgi:predicted RNA-binding protein with PIN domain
MAKARRASTAAPYLQRMTARRRWLVDGMNVIGARPTGWWRDRTGAMRDLAAALSAFAAKTGEHITLVLDGRERDLGEHPGVEVVWAPGPGPNAADRVLAELAEQAEDREALVAVTSDRALAERLASLGVEVEGAGAFRRRLDELT